MTDSAALAQINARLNRFEEKLDLLSGKMDVCFNGHSDSPGIFTRIALTEQWIVNAKWVIGVIGTAVVGIICDVAHRIVTAR